MIRTLLISGLVLTATSAIAEDRQAISIEVAKGNYCDMVIDMDVDGRTPIHDLGDRCLQQKIDALKAWRDTLRSETPR